MLGIFSRDMIQVCMLLSKLLKVFLDDLTHKAAHVVPDWFDGQFGIALECILSLSLVIDHCQSQSVDLLAMGSCPHPMYA